MQNLLHSTDAPLPEYKTQSLKKSRLILSHYGVFKGCWDWLILVATIYIAVAVPYNASFVKNFERLTMPSDVIVEALFIVGVCIYSADEDATAMRVRGYDSNGSPIPSTPLSHHSLLVSLSLSFLFLPASLCQILS